MAKFCEGCPNIGNCWDDIIGFTTESMVAECTISEDMRSASLSFESGVPQGPTILAVRFHDEDGGSSELINIHGDSGTDAEDRAYDYVNKIERCAGPTEIKKFLGLISRKECAAPQA